MAAKIWKLTTTRERARMLSITVTQPNRERDLKDSAKAMELDEALREANHLYDGALEELVAEHQRLNRRFVGRQQDPEYQQASMRINQGIEDLDNEVGQEPLDILLESRLFTYARDVFLDLKGVPADRKLGPKYQALRKDLEDAKQVEVEERPNVRDPT